MSVFFFTFFVKSKKVVGLEQTFNACIILQEQIVLTYK